MPDKTPGEVAYDAFWQAFAARLGTHGADAWAALHPGTQQSWDAAAQAVRDLVLRELIAGGAQAREERDHD